MPAADPVVGSDRLFVVTTRSRLKDVRFFPAMYLASRRIRQQLRDTGEVVRWASVVAGPTEFWTITAWRSRHDMQLFMRSGAHDEIMWLFARWLRSFWLMRWRPTTEEIGAWQGATLAPPAADEGPLVDDAERAARRALLDRALAELPRLRAATGPSGAATYETSPGAERRRAEVGNAAGAVVRLQVAPWRTFGALAELRELRTDCGSRPGLLRIAVGIGRPGEVYLLGLWANPEGPSELLASPTVRDLHQRLGERCWAIAWTPENEFGHWDGLRVRRERVRQTLSMSPEEAALGEDEPARPTHTRRRSLDAARRRMIRPGAR
ncbi:MAG: hypothetical protein ABIV94_02845 [Acidimicrobiales bacterium]